MKKTLCVLCGLCLLLLVAACGQSTERTEAPDDIRQVLVSPLPEEGFKVAEIDGCDYYFDTHYLYKLFMGIYGDPPKRESVEEAIWYELLAAEAAEQGITADPTDVDWLLSRYEYETEWLEENIAELESGKEHWSEFPADDRRDLEKSLETKKTRLERIQKVHAEILAEENITEEAFLEELRPYAEKMAMARACENALLESCDEETAENAIAFQGWFRDQKQRLWEKYHVKITY